jgi:hypothetical protein
MESLMTLAIIGAQCIRGFSIFIRWVEFHPLPPPPLLLQPRQHRLDLPLDLEECHGKFGDASYYRDQMHKEQTDRQTDKHSSLYIYRCKYYNIVYRIDFK